MRDGGLASSRQSCEESEFGLHEAMLRRCIKVATAICMRQF